MLIEVNIVENWSPRGLVYSQVPRRAALVTLSMGKLEGSVRGRRVEESFYYVAVTSKDDDPVVSFLIMKQIWKDTGDTKSEDFHKTNIYCGDLVD